MKIGFLGGSFDPVHLGHLVAAQDVYEQFRLDRLVFVPAAQAPLKPNTVQSSGSDRLAMIRAAIEGDDRFEVSDLELRRGGTSYTIDSVRELGAAFPASRLFWIIGTDQLSQLDRWKNIGELVREVEFILLQRPGFAAGGPWPEIQGLRIHACEGHLLAISSTELRARVERGLALNYFVPDRVKKYIDANHLYRKPNEK